MPYTWNGRAAVGTRPRIPTLPDGSMLVDPRPKPARDLHRGEWVQIDGEPWQIKDLLSTHRGGRVLHLDGRAPYVVDVLQTIPVYQVHNAKGTRAW